jgi:thioredoxin-related protein
MDAPKYKKTLLFGAKTVIYCTNLVKPLHHKNDIKNIQINSNSSLDDINKS